MAMKLTISPTEASPLSLRKIPTSRIVSKLSVVAARVSTATTAHHDSCACSSEFTMPLSADTSISTRAKLCTTATLPSVSAAVSARSE